MYNCALDLEIVLMQIIKFNDDELWSEQKF